MINKSIDSQSEELEHLKWQTTKLQCTYSIINRTLLSVGVDASIIIVNILGVNRPLCESEDHFNTTMCKICIHNTSLTNIVLYCSVLA